MPPTAYRPSQPMEYKPAERAKVFRQMPFGKKRKLLCRFAPLDQGYLLSNGVIPSERAALFSDFDAAQRRAMLETMSPKNRSALLLGTEESWLWSLIFNPSSPPMSRETHDPVTADAEVNSVSSGLSRNKVNKLRLFIRAGHFWKISCSRCSFPCAFVKGWDGGG